MKHKLCILLITTLFAAPAVMADGIPIEPGLWEITSTMQMPMLPEPRVTTTTECMENSEITMDDMGTEDMDPNCTADVSQVDSNTMKWSFDCPVQGGTSHGEWEMVSEGDSVSGNGVITMSFQGQAMEMTMEWEGHRVGNCP